MLERHTSRHPLAVALLAGVLLTIGAAVRVAAEPQEGTGDAVGTGLGVGEGSAEGTGSMLSLVGDYADAAETPSPELAEVDEIVTDLLASQERIQELERLATTAAGEELDLIRVEAGGIIELATELMRQLIDRLDELDSEGIDTDEYRDGLGRFLNAAVDFFLRTINRSNDRLIELRASRAEIAAEEQDDLEERIRQREERLNDLLTFLMSTLSSADSLGLDSSKGWEFFDRFLDSRAQALIGRIQLAISNRDSLEDRIDDARGAGMSESELAALRVQLRTVQRRIRANSDNLELTADLLDQRGQSTTAYREFVIQATGEVTESLLKPRVFVALLKNTAKSAWAWSKDNVPRFFVYLLVLIASVAIFRLVFRLLWAVARMLRLVKLSHLAMDLMGRLLRPVATVFGLVAGFWFLGADPTTLLASVGVVSVIIGFALQDSLSNLVAGFFLIAYHPYDVDDVVVFGKLEGNVRGMGFANTTIVTFDGRRLVVPNRKIWSDVIENRSAEPKRRADLTVRVSYRDDLKRAYEVIREVLEEDERVLDEPEPHIFVSSWEDHWMEVSVRPWTANRDWWSTLSSLRGRLRLRFEEEGLEMPFPKREIVSSPTEPSEPSAD